MTQTIWKMMREILLKLPQPITIRGHRKGQTERTLVRRHCTKIALMAIVGACSLARAEPPAKPKRELIGEVLGKPVYRDELHPKYPSPTEDDELHRLFLDPVLEKYIAAHRAELEPTRAELDAVEALLEKRSKPRPVATLAEIRKALQQANDELRKQRSEFSRSYLEACKHDLEGILLGQIPMPMTKESEASPDSVSGDLLKEVSARLAQKNLPLLERVSLTFEKWWWEQQIAHPARMVAPFLYGNWKLQRHFYDHFGGGRVMYQQAGLEAFDAYRRWIESEELKGSF